MLYERSCCRMCWALRSCQQMIHGRIMRERPHQRRTMGRIFTVKDYQRLRVDGGGIKQVPAELLFVVEVLSTVDMSTIVLVFEAAVNDHNLVVLVFVFTVKHGVHGLLVDTRKAVGFVFWYEVGKMQLMAFLDIHDGV
jgi:hypothetical protein